MHKIILLILTTTNVWASTLDEYLALKAAHKQQKAELKAAYTERTYNVKKSELNGHEAHEKTLLQNLNRAFEKMILARTALSELNATAEHPPTHISRQSSEQQIQTLADYHTLRQEHMLGQHDSFISFIRARQEVEECMIRRDYDPLIKSIEIDKKRHFASLVVPALILTNIVFFDLPKIHVSFLQNSLTLSNALIILCSSTHQVHTDWISYYNFFTSAYEIIMTMLTGSNHDLVRNNLLHVPRYIESRGLTSLQALAIQSSCYLIIDSIGLLQKAKKAPTLISQRDKKIMETPLYTYLNHLTLVNEL